MFFLEIKHMIIYFNSLKIHTLRDIHDMTDAAFKEIEAKMAFYLLFISALEHRSYWFWSVNLYFKTLQ